MQAGLSAVDVANNFNTLKNDIAVACAKAARDPADVHIIAVSKGHDFALIRTLYHLGQRDFGESYAQELAHKQKLAKNENLEDIRFHFIGAIQSNKLKIIKESSAVHSLGSLEHADILNKLVKDTLDVFLQINLDENPKRSGFVKNELVPAVKYISELDHLNLKGLMAILPQRGSADDWFSKMVTHKQFLLAHGLMRKVALSMGMSDDFIPAIYHGAQYLRIGSRIFGKRGDQALGERP